MGFIGKALPGEHDGTLDPRDYGIEVIRDEPMTPEEQERQQQNVAYILRAARALTGIESVSPRHARFIDDHLNRQPYDLEPARRLAARHDELPDPYECRFGAAKLEIDQGVFCPVLTQVSPFFREYLPSARNKRTLDAFTGSGAFAVNAALEGGTVVAYDNSSRAVACAQKNASKNGVANRMKVRQGTLHEVIASDAQFDLIIANPPLIPGEPHDALEGSLFDNGLHATQELLEALPRLLAKRGEAYIVTSDVIDREGYKCDIEAICKDNGMFIQTIARRHLEYESYRVHRIEHPSVRTLTRKLFNNTVAISTKYT